MSANIKADATILPPIATDAATAHRSPGICPLCRYRIRAGERYALIVPDGQPAHVPCVARMDVPQHRGR